MKNLLLSIVVFSCISCEINDNGVRICCVSPPHSSLIHIGGINASDELEENLSSKVALYYLSEDGKKYSISRESPKGLDVSFSNVSNLRVSESEIDPCYIRVENHLSLLVHDLPKISHQKNINRLYLQVEENVDTIDLLSNYYPNSWIKYGISSIKLNGDSLINISTSSKVGEYYFSHNWKKGEEKITCLPNNTHLSIRVSDAHLVSGLVDDVQTLVANISQKNRVKVFYKQDSIEKVLNLNASSVYFLSEDSRTINDYDKCLSCTSFLENIVTIILPMELLELATAEEKVEAFSITLNGVKTHSLTIDSVIRIPMEQSTLKNLSHDEFIVKRVSIDGITLDGSSDRNVFYFSETWDEGAKKPWPKATLNDDSGCEALAEEECN